jgi:hypothetical protein
MYFVDHKTIEVYIVIMDWANSVDQVKSTQSNLKTWVGSDNWVDMGLKNENPHKKSDFGQNRTKPKIPTSPPIS